MHQDIKTFSELMDIDTSKLLCVEYTLKELDNSTYKFYINDIECNSEGKLLLDLNDSLRFQLDVDVGAVEITSIRINDFEVIPKYMHHSSNGNHWTSEKTSWQFNIKHFYTWKHEITGDGWIA